jgi:hypothetical protein
MQRLIEDEDDEHRAATTSQRKTATIQQNRAPLQQASSTRGVYMSGHSAWTLCAALLLACSIPPATSATPSHGAQFHRIGYPLPRTPPEASLPSTKKARDLGPTPLNHDDPASEVSSRKLMAQELCSPGKA